MTTLALVLLLVAVVGLAVATTVGYIRGGLPVATPDVPPPLDAPVAAPADLDRARFGLAFRGYRMDQVDEVLDGARDAMAGRDEEIARLRAILDEAAQDGRIAGWEPSTWYPTSDEARAAERAADEEREVGVVLTKATAPARTPVEVAAEKADVAEEAAVVEETAVAEGAAVVEEAAAQEAVPAAPALAPGADSVPDPATATPRA